MAQTISVSKSNTAMTFNGTTNYTLFTLASGTASRVIMNGMSLYRDDATTGTFYAMINIYNATTGNIPIGYAFGLGGAIDAMAYTVGNMSGMNSSGSGAGTMYPNTVMYKSATSSGNPMGDRNASQGNFEVPSSSSYGIYMPSQFWMCNGDQLRIKSNWSSATGYCQASFTIITES
jgi:hypothetical protein